MGWWQRWHARRPILRFFQKAGLLTAVTVVVLYPNYTLFQTWISRLRDMNSVLQPDHPGLAEFETAARAAASAGGKEPTQRDLELAAQSVVYKRVPYAWDWDTWGVVDYLPNVDEVLKLGREDCDGRAVVQASLLRRMGIHANIVSDILHVWVETPDGATMHPTSSVKVLVSKPDGGTSVNLTPGLLANVVRGTAYGFGAFPLGREVILLLTLCAVLLQPRSSLWRRVSGCLLLALALALIRGSGIKAAMEGTREETATVLVGAACIVAGVIVLTWKSRREPVASC
jgi:hypothetical protein